MCLVYFALGVWQYCDRVSSVVLVVITHTSAFGQRRTHQGIDLVINDSCKFFCLTYILYFMLFLHVMLTGLAMKGLFGMLKC
jgi:hypothetical protein